MKLYTVGNCQAAVLAEILTRATGVVVERTRKEQVKRLRPSEPHYIFAQPQCKDWVEGNIVCFPRLIMPGFHPDILISKNKKSVVRSPLRNYNSSIVMKAWYDGLSEKNTLELFNKKTFERLDFFSYFEASKAGLLAEGLAAGLPLEDRFDEWLEAGCFMHTVNHPKGRVLIDIAEAVLSKTNLDWKPIDQEIDPLGDGCGWPVYPELAERIGVNGSYEFRTNSLDGGKILDLKQFIEQSFALYAKQNVDRRPLPDRLTHVRYQDLQRTLPADGRHGTHPYAGLPENQFWRKSVHGDVDPVTSSFTIGRHERIATAGSCFAQHIARALRDKGFNYFVAETDPGTGGANYGVFSARYGNIYTVRQLVQLFDRSYGQYDPKDSIWQRGDRFVDPFRPEIEPDGFVSAQALLASRETHFEAVRKMFERLDVFVFTLGLTEFWRAKVDGAVFPLAPGVSGGLYNPELYEFANFSVAEVVQDLAAFLDRLRAINHSARVILTVSPVPLAATYEPRHVLVSTTYSKSVLRVAAEEIARTCEQVFYFPSYEIITGTFSRGRYFAENLRDVTAEGVDHVMRMFLRHFTPDPEIEASVRRAFEVVCEEEQLANLS